MKTLLTYYFIIKGNIIFEMLTGLPPFTSSNRNSLYEKIKTQNPDIPKFLSIDCQNLIEGLLEKCPEKRLGFNGSNSIKNHSFFSNINWNFLYEKKINPPFIPFIKSELDVSNFDPV